MGSETSSTIARPLLKAGDFQTATTPSIGMSRFVGFGPHRYDEVFEAGERRDGSQLARHEPSKACPIGADWNEVGVRSKEDEVVLATAQAVARLTALDPPAGDSRTQSSADQPSRTTPTDAVGGHQ